MCLCTALAMSGMIASFYEEKIGVTTSCQHCYIPIKIEGLILFL